MTTEEEGDMVTPQTLYPSLVQLVVHAEATSWNRFYNFLMFNTILILAWSTIYVAQTRPSGAAAILATMAALGALSGIAMAALGVRGRKFLDEYVGLAVKIEADPKCWSETLAQYKPLTLTKDRIAKFPFGWAGSRYLLTWGPLALTGFYVFLFHVSIR
jgi:hypothetical protein